MAETQRDLARLGRALGEKDGELFKATLRAIASPQSGPVGSEESLDFAADQVLSSAPDATVEKARDYVDAFDALYDLNSMADVHDLLGREHCERRGYKGQLAFVEEGQ